MQTTLDALVNHPQEEEVISPVSVVIIYEDFAAGMRARRTLEYLSSQLAQDGEFRSTMWKFDVLRFPKLRQMAARDAADADIIIISSNAEHSLPESVESWLEESAAARQGREGGLIALTELDHAGSPGATSTYLRQLANKAGLDFFEHSASKSYQQMPLSIDVADQRKDAVASLLGNVLHPEVCPRWGINE